MSSTIVDWLINTFLKNQFSTIGAFIGGLAVAHGAAAGYTPAQIDGAVICLLSVGAQYAENYLRTKNAALAAQQTPKA
jgi:hypothetical protein